MKKPIVILSCFVIVVAIGIFSLLYFSTSATVKRNFEIDKNDSIKLEHSFMLPSGEVGIAKTEFTNEEKKTIWKYMKFLKKIEGAQVNDSIMGTPPLMEIENDKGKLWVKMWMPEKIEVKRFDAKGAVIWQNVYETDDYSLNSIYQIIGLKYPK